MADKPTTIDAYHAAQDETDRAICDRLRAIIDDGLDGAEIGIWYGHPVWKIMGNPIVGYKKLKACIRLLFWSGQSFETPGLTPEGTFKAAELRFTAPAQIDGLPWREWLSEAARIQWDYQNIVKRKGELIRL